MAKKRKAKPGAKALRNIRKQQKRTNLLLQKKPFERVVRESMKTNNLGIERLKGRALEAIQYATEAYSIRIMEQANRIAINAGRSTVYSRDVNLVMKVLDGVCPC